MARRIPIDPKTVRYKIAQFLLTILYGRKWHYISPWRHASIASCVVLVKDNKVLMGKRRGNIENAGVRDHPGGHVNIENNEGLIDACVRETYEEMCINIDPSKITENKLVDIYFYNYKYIEHIDSHNICLTYMYEVSDEELSTLEETEESHDFKWLDEGDIKNKLKEQLIPIERKYYERALKALAKVKK